LVAGISLTVWLLRAGSELGRVDKLVVGGIWAVLVGVIVGGYFLVEKAGERELARLRDQISGFTPTYAEELSAMGHEKITVDTPADDPLYLAMIQKQIRWLELNPSIADIYTFRKHPNGNQLIVDSETDYDRSGSYEGDREQRTEIGEIWDEFNDYFMQAFSGESAFDDIPYTDRWGTWVSAYVPMLDEAGRVEAVLGVDFPAEKWVAAMKNLSVITDESKAKVKRGELPTVTGNEAQLIQLFQNLISNAIKFCQDGEPEIDISAREVGQGDESWWIFSVRDNGPGISEEHHQRIY